MIIDKLFVKIDKLCMKNEKMRTMKQKLVINTGVSMALLLLVSMLISVFSLILTGNERLSSQESNSRAAFDRLIQEQASNALSVADFYHKKHIAGEMTLEQAKKAAADVIRSMKYGESGYFWADTSQGDNVVLLGSSTEGTNRLDAKDSNGFAFLKSLIAQSKQPGGGYTDYRFPKAGQSEALPKRAYTVYFQPFDWVIGTGNYVDDIDAEIATLRNSIQIETVVLIIVTIGVGVLLLFVGLGFTVRLAKSFSDQLNGLLIVSNQVAKGDTNIHILESDIVEIQQLNQSFATVVKGIHEQVVVLENIANGNFTVNIDARSEQDVLVQSINKMISLLNHTLNQINISADQVSNGSSQVSDGAQSLAQSAMEQASSIELLSTEIAGVSAQIKNTADNAVNINQLSGVVGKKINASSNQMTELSAAMSEISQSSEKISKIIQVIKDIVLQTNILALNAAIEAAQAGSAGKGFAVVADEIRNLATKSGEAAKQTGLLIDNSVLSVQKGVKIAQTTATSLAEVVIGAKEITQLIDGISQASAVQNESILQIMAGIDQISSVVQTNSATSEESAAASEELSSQAEMMKSLISRFQLTATENQLKS